MFAQSDMHDSNFGVDDHGRTVLMNFNEIGMLPETFVAYTLYCSNKKPIAAALGLSGDSNLTSMATISYTLWMVTDKTLGTSTCACHGNTEVWLILVIGMTPELSKN